MALPAHYTQRNALTEVPTSAVTFTDIRRDADRYPRLNSVPREVAVTAMEQIVFRAFFNHAGTQLRDEDAASRVNLIASELLDILLEDYEEIGTKFLSFAEIARVTRTASVSKGREMYGVSVNSLYRSIADYCLGEGHKASQEVMRERLASGHKPQMIQIDEAQRKTIETVASRIAAAKTINK